MRDTPETRLTGWAAEDGQFDGMTWVGKDYSLKQAKADARAVLSECHKSGTNEFVPFGEGYPPFSDLRRRHPAEATLRRLLAMNYSGPALYGDDGELQDSRMPMIDFQRDSVEDIERKIYERGMAEYAKQLHKPVPSECRHPVLTSSPTTANRCASCGALVPLPSEDSSNGRG